MLVQLRIRHIALIESVELEFGPGLNVLTGETGAGKSIVIDSINLALGARGDRELIQTGSPEARVEMAFDITGNETVRALLADMGLESDDDLLVISRQINTAGRNLCRVNGALATVAQLRQLTGLLIDIHGQHEHQSLLNEANHLELLDGFGGEGLLARRAAVADVYRRVHALRGEIERLYGNERDRARRADILRYQIKEIQSAKLVPGEEEELSTQLQMLQNAETIAAAVREAYDRLYDGGERGRSAVDSVGVALHELTRIEGYGEQFAALKTRLEQALLELEDLSGELRGLNGSFEFDEEDLNELEERLDLIRQLKRKYGADIPGILDTSRAMEQELNDLENADERLQQLTAERDALERELTATCQALTALRRAAASRFEQAVVGQLGDLGMEHARFSVEFEERPGAVAELAGPKGSDRLRFLLSPNPGEPLKPLAKIASGGEMSRIMLALKNIAADSDSIPTLIFDEIDTGISGNMSRVVAEKLAHIGLTHQVLCVTHTAQIAAMGNQHFFIEKSTDGQHTTTRVQPLDSARRVDEIGRLVGGDVSSLSRQHASEMLAWSEKFKAGL